MPSERRNSRSLNARKNARKVRSKERKAREARDAKKLEAKKLALALHNKRNAQAHFEAQKRKTEYELEKSNNVVYVDEHIQQKIVNIIDNDIEDFLWLKSLMSNSRIENEPLRLYIPDLYVLRLISLNKTIRAINDKIDALNELCERALYTQIIHGGLKVTVVLDSFGVCVYIIVPSTHKKFKTCTDTFNSYTYDKILDDGSIKFGWDFGDPNAMLMYKIKKLIGTMGDGHLSSTELCDKISSLCIITMKDVNKLIVEQISFLLAFNSHLF